ncbi:MAG: tetratricopeptide repeat protein [Verrucomicrobia bacterium]|nr:tetratricopeptide repeat protein [Verrucomicrobiota bacterium]
MNHPAPSPTLSRPPASPTLAVAAVLAALALAAYANSFSVPFLLDDIRSIVENITIRDLSAWRQVLSPPPNVGVGGRPLLNATFALNYAAGGLAVRGYHLVNLAIHVLAALALYGLARRTLLTAPLRVRFGRDATLLAGLIAALCLVHPLQTNAVTYVSQRAESLMGLLYFSTLYCFVRGAEPETAESRASRLLSPVPLLLLSVVSCALGVFVKEVIATAPLLALLYDRTFLAGSFRAALRRRWGFYAALAATWLLLPASLAGVSERGVGSDPEISSWTYALTQTRAVVDYLRLTFWPHPLVFYRGAEFATSLREVAVPAAALAAIVAGVAVALWRHPALGFAGAWFFVILAPTSSVIPIVNLPVAESRTYLPIAGVIAAVVLALYARFARAALFVGAGLCLLLVAVTLRRNHDYRSALTIAADNLAQRPQSAEVQAAYAYACYEAGRLPDAVTHWQTALRLKPTYARAHGNLATAFVTLERWPEAMDHYRAALRLRPDYVEARVNFAALLIRTDELPAAIAHLRLATRLAPEDPLGWQNLGIALARVGDLSAAVTCYERALTLRPEFPEAHNNLANALAALGRRADALRHFATALRLRPDYFDALCNYGNRLAEDGRGPEGIAQLERAVQLRPRHAGARFLLGQALERVGRRTEAALALEQALRLDPALPLARDALARLRAAAPE